MISKRFSIYHLMACVGVVAFNLAVFRALYSSRRIDILVGGAAVWVVLQVGGALAIRGHGLSRSYWLGFVVGGALASFTFMAARSFPGSVVGRVWRGYSVVAEELLFNDRLQNGVARVVGNIGCELAVALIFTAAEFAPLVLAAWAGGVLARRISSRNA